MPCPSKDAPRDRKRSHPPGLVASVKINQGPVERWNRLDPGCPGCSKVSAPMRQLPPVALPRHFQGAPSSEKITGSARVSRFLRLDYEESQTSHKKKKLRGFFSKWRTSQFVSCISEQVVARLMDLWCHGQRNLLRWLGVLLLALEPSKPWHWNCNIHGIPMDINIWISCI